MDAALKAYARKRRQDAGAALEMHPATRRLLQGEVAHLHGRGKKTSSGSGWLRFLPRIGFALSIAIVLGVVYWSLRPPPSQLELAASSEPAQPAMQDRERASVVEKKVALNERETQIVQAPRDFRENANVKLKDMAEAPAAAPMRPAPSGPPGVPQFRSQSAPASVAAVPTDFAKRAATLSEQTLDDKIEVFNAPVVTAGPATNAAMVGALLSAKQQVEDSGFARALNAAPEHLPLLVTAEGQPAKTELAAARAETLGRADRNEVEGAAKPELAFFFSADTSGAPTAAALPTAAVEFEAAQAKGAAGDRTYFRQSDVSAVLRNFELRQSGNDVTLVDADGSVYEGVATAQTDLYATEALARDESQKKDGAELRKLTSAARAPSAATERARLAITARGTNRTLNQLVVLNGTLESDSSATNSARLRSSSPQSASSTRGLQPNLPTTSNQMLRFRGQFRVGATNQMSIEAIRVR
jgi:hypothetical protein